MRAVECKVVRKWLRRGFSLVEITLALGIASFALIAILGLFPVAMKASIESRHETQATFIARTIFSDLAAGEPQNATLFGSGTKLDLAQTTRHSEEFTEDGQPVGGDSEATSVVYGAEVNVTPLADAQEGLSRVQVTISAPPGGGDNAYEYTFVTLMRNQ